MIGDSGLGWRGTSINGLLLVAVTYVAALILIKRGSTILGPAWALFALCVLGENVHDAKGVFFTC